VPVAACIDIVMLRHLLLMTTYMGIHGAILHGSGVERKSVTEVRFFFNPAYVKSTFPVFVVAGVIVGPERATGPSAGGMISWADVF
jgi:hypothetical protein